MAIMDTILTTPTNIADLKKKATPPSNDDILGKVFVNFIDYAKKHWSYTASSNKGGKDLLDGSATAVPCGGFATALKQVFETAVPGISVNMEQRSWVWTDAAYKCFDSKVTGNVRKLDDKPNTPKSYNNGFIFPEHYFLSYNGKYYDPTLGHVFTTSSGGIKETFPVPNRILVGISDKLIFTADKRTCFFPKKTEEVQGFSAAYVMFKATKKNIAKVVGDDDYKKEMARKSPNAFKTFVDSLKDSESSTSSFSMGSLAAKLKG